MVRKKFEAKYLFISGFQFGGICRIIERYEKVKQGLVCMTYCDIGHEQIGSCRNQPLQCIICNNYNKIEEH